MPEPQGRATHLLCPRGAWEPRTGPGTQRHPSSVTPPFLSASGSHPICLLCAEASPFQPSLVAPLLGLHSPEDVFPAGGLPSCQKLLSKRQICSNLSVTPLNFQDTVQTPCFKHRFPASGAQPASADKPLSPVHLCASSTP